MNAISMVVKLPYVPSQLIRLALGDLRKCEAQPGTYRINMSHWHTADAHAGTCSVCLAGSVMAQTVGVSPGLNYAPENDIASNTQAYWFLDRMRAADLPGYMEAGCRYIGARPIKWKKWIPAYSNNAESFHQLLSELADAFEADGQ